ncbi:MAG: RNA polymerase ECF-type sigma factor, partial [uncultured Solirubrobacteraceae bacterium]
MRRRARFDASLATIAEQIETNARDAAEWEGQDIPDDRLRLIFTC